MSVRASVLPVGPCVVACFAMLATACTSDDDDGGVTGPPTSTATGAGGGVAGSGGHAGGQGGATSTGGSGGAGGSSPCPADMVLAGATCVDRYEAPNEAAAYPLAFQTAYEGEDWCEARGKRLCTDAEWIRACEGSTGTLYPYGDDHIASRCNDGKTWISPNWSVLALWPAQEAIDEAERLYQADPSGFRADCISEDGAGDLTGNVAEWVVRTIPNSTNHDHVMKGCYWAGCFGGTLPNCTFVNPAHPGDFRSYEAGFRCCSDPADG